MPRARLRSSTALCTTPRSSPSKVKAIAVAKLSRPRRPSRHAAPSPRTDRPVQISAVRRDRQQQLHEQAFRRLGGSTATVVLDNLREGVITPDVYDPLINPLYRDVLAHYGVVALPCRVRDPDRKGKVESGIAHTQNAL